MAGATFGRKGMAGGAVALPQRAAFGGHLQAPLEPADADDPYAAQRAEFLASERTRSEAGQARSFAPERATRSIHLREKTLFTAYLLWFILGQLSAHRFYLGRMSAGIAQVCLWLVSCLMLVGGFTPGFVGLLANAVWVIGDAFLMPGLVRKANERARQNGIGETFA